MSSRIALILGAGPRTGLGLAQGFSKAGYTVVTVSRTPRHYDGTSKLALSADFTDSASIPTVFDQVRAKLGEPEVVIYNSSGTTAIRSDAKDPFANPTDGFVADLTVNVTSVYVAAQESIKSFRALESGKRGYFFAVGNMFNNSPPPTSMMNSGLGKTALASLMSIGHKAYGPQGHSFIYADERNADGDAVYGKVDGDAHAEAFLALIKGEQPKTHYYTFAKGLGAKKVPIYDPYTPLW